MGCNLSDEERVYKCGSLCITDGYPNDNYGLKICPHYINDEAEKLRMLLNEAKFHYRRMKEKIAELKAKDGIE